MSFVLKLFPKHFAKLSPSNYFSTTRPPNKPRTNNTSGETQKETFANNDCEWGFRKQMKSVPLNWIAGQTKARVLSARSRFIIHENYSMRAICLCRGFLFRRWRKAITSIFQLSLTYKVLDNFTLLSSVKCLANGEVWGVRGCRAAHIWRSLHASFSTLSNHYLYH